MQFWQTDIGMEEIPDTWKTDKIVVIPKSGKDLTLPQSYCPISLQNIDYKIVTSILTARLNKVLGFYIHSDQSGFFKGRYLMDNTRCIQNIIKYVHYTKEPSLLYFVDTEKAFDSVEWEFLYRIMARMSFDMFS